jgi:hypothetical protein
MRVQENERDGDARQEIIYMLEQSINIVLGMPTCADGLRLRIQSSETVGDQGADAKTWTPIPHVVIIVIQSMHF